MKLDQRQENRLRDLEHAWNDRKNALDALDAEYEEKRTTLEKAVYENVVNLTAAALEVGIPKRQIGKAVGTANYAANRKQLHKDAEAALLAMGSAPGAAAEVAKLDLKNVEDVERWADSLTFTYDKSTGDNLHEFDVKDPYGITDRLFLAYGSPSAPAGNHVLDSALIDVMDILTPKMKEAMHV